MCFHRHFTVLMKQNKLFLKTPGKHCYQWGRVYFQFPSGENFPVKPSTWKTICSKECWYSYCYGNQIGHYLFYFLVYHGWLKWNKSDWQRQKRRWSSCLSLRRHTRQTCRNSYEKSKLETKYTKERKKKN